MDYSDLPLPAASAMAHQSVFPFYQSTLCDPSSAKTSMNKDDSGLTYNFSSSRKRSRDQLTIEINDTSNTKLPSANSWPFLDQDLLPHIHNQQSEIDLLIAQHADNVRMELEEQRMRQLTVLHSAIQEVMMKKLKEKDEEIQKIRKLNWVLQERVKILTQENQIWKELAESNESTANSLRCNLEQVLAAHVSEGQHHHTVTAAAEVDDVKSCCRSNGEGQWTAEAGKDTASGRRSCETLCGNCGVRESILLLPCRRVSLCTRVGPGVTIARYVTQQLMVACMLISVRNLFIYVVLY
ncbi:E3 ubiquitin-protein ligase BOI-like [Prosopis cineraria]|uniref:E3 ubiquitin-protein ligase BOI-like n=1 Tax=Prosopis cineraria TaxID=364024 RepID=UPI00241054B4|nr:E3 ubiquitin-protein ligase BOI-like [Prosopis cineraria]